MSSVRVCIRCVARGEDGVAWAYGAPRARVQAIGERVGRGGASDTDRAMGLFDTLIRRAPASPAGRIHMVHVHPKFYYSAITSRRSIVSNDGEDIRKPRP